MPSDSLKILLVDDDIKLGQLISEFLGQYGYVVSTEADGLAAVTRIVDEQPDLVILDLMLPGLDGLDICRRVRSSFNGLILMLTARGDDVDEIVGFEIGADDYIAKPVKPRLLLAHIRAMFRRKERTAAVSRQPSTIIVGELRIDEGRREVSVGKKLIPLTTSEFDLLLFLALHRGEVLSRDRIYQELRGIDYDGVDRSIDLRISRLRRKIGDDQASPQWIKSIRGVGYLFSE